MPNAFLSWYPSFCTVYQLLQAFTGHPPRSELRGIDKHDPNTIYGHGTKSSTRTLEGPAELLLHYSRPIFTQG